MPRLTSAGIMTKSVQDAGIDDGTHEEVREDAGLPSALSWL